MILVDPRTGSTELLWLIRKFGVEAELAKPNLEFGDFAFEGNGPNGRILIGVERKTVGDLLNCIDDGRYAGHQRPGMRTLYGKSVLILEGVWKPDTSTGYLMHCVRALTWIPLRYRSQMTRYSKLSRYLYSIMLSGDMVIRTREMMDTAYELTELYAYFNKQWSDHMSLCEIQKLAIPELMGKPSLVRKWASDLDGIGTKLSMEADSIFRTGLDLAMADELAWLRIPKLGVRAAQQIIRQIRTPRA